MREVIVVGGGITGAGIARDLALRGVGVTLIERDVPAAGATGRCHGLLHSGARYAVKDARAAAECASEGRILKRLAPHCIEDTGGFFLGLTEGDVAYGDRLVPACRKAGVAIEPTDPRHSPNPAALASYQVRDAAIDPFLLTLSTLQDAHRNGARIVLGRTVVKVAPGEVVLDGGERLRADAIVAAAGYESARLLARSGRPAAPVQADKGTLLVTERRACEQVVNRLRLPADGDIVVPGHATSIIGTTSTPSESTVPSRDEYRTLLSEAVLLLPALKHARVIRAFSGVRPLKGSGDARSLSRDHQVSEDEGIFAVTGGKLTTYRLVAEHAADTVMRFLGARGSCVTAVEPLPDIRQEEHGEIVCGCESAGRRLAPLDFLKNVDVARYDRLGFGACQGMRCAKSAGAPETFLQERWKGVRPVLDEGQLQQAYVSWASYRTRAGGRHPR